MPRSPFFIPLLLALTLAVATPAAAEPPAGSQPEQAPPAANAPDDTELSAFVASFLRLIGVQHGYRMLMRDEIDPARLEEIKHSALTDMKSAVERDGLSVARYNEIALTVRDDPGVRDRVENLLQQMAATPDDSPDADEE